MEWEEGTLNLKIEELEGRIRAIILRERVRDVVNKVCLCLLKRGRPLYSEFEKGLADDSQEATTRGSGSFSYLDGLSEIRLVLFPARIQCYCI